MALELVLEDLPSVLLKTSGLAPAGPRIG
jgi:hypothetical protein